MPDDLLARMDAERKRYAEEREANRARFPFAMSMVDPIRTAGLEPKLRHAVNAAGEVLGRPPELPGIGVDGDKLAHLPEFEASWRRFYAKQPENQKTYNERAQRAVRPHMHRGTE